MSTVHDVVTVNSKGLKVAPKNNRKPKAPVQPVAFVCPHCQTSFKRERSIVVHMCEKKRRLGDSSRPSHKLAFTIYQKVWTRTSSAKTPQTIETFIESSLYTAIVRFANYVLEIDAIHPLMFCDYLITERVSIDDWRKPSLYEKYVRWLSIKESSDAALARTILLMERWSKETGEEWTDFFRKVSTSQATLWIQAGRISPWVLFTANSARDLFGRMSDEQLEMVNGFIDPNFWSKRILDNADDVEALKDILQKANL